MRREQHSLDDTLLRCGTPRRRASLIVVFTLFLSAMANPASAQVAPPADGYRWIGPPVVNLRSGPGTEFDAVDQLRRGDRLWLVYVEAGWAEVQIPVDDGWKYGYIRADLLLEDAPQIQPLADPRRRDALQPSSRPAHRWSRSPREIDNSSHFWLLLLLIAVVALIVAALARRTRGTRGRSARTPPPLTRPREFQNSGERRLSHQLERRFRAPDYHLMNHITLPLGTGTTQIDHILLSRFGIFVVETKDYKGWIFGDAAGLQWTQVVYRRKFQFQNPILQNRRHVQAVSALLDFLPAGAIRSIVAFVGDGEFKTPMPEFVLYGREVPNYIAQQSTEVMTRDQLQLCVGRLETARLAITGETDLAHIRNVERWHGRKA